MERFTLLKTARDLGRALLNRLPQAAPLMEPAREGGPRQRIFNGRVVVLPHHGG